MKVLIIIGVIFLLLGLFLLTRARVQFVYSDEEFRLIAGTRLIKITLIPSKKDKKPKTDKKKEKKKPKQEKTGSQKGGEKMGVDTYITTTVKVLERFRKHFSVDSLVVRYVSANEDPFSAAMNFGRASAAAGILDPLLNSALKIKSRRFETAVSFDGGGDSIFIDLTCSMAVYELIYIVLGIMPVFVGRKKASGDGKVDKNG